MDTNASAAAIRTSPTLEPAIPGNSGRDGHPFVDLIREHGEWLERECQEIARWVHEQTGTGPEEVRLSRTWLGEDSQVGVLVFRVSVKKNSDGQGLPVTDWWVVREQSGERWLYPCLLSTAGDTVRYHHQIRTVQLKK